MSQEVLFKHKVQFWWKYTHCGRCQGIVNVGYFIPVAIQKLSLCQMTKLTTLIDEPLLSQTINYMMIYIHVWESDTQSYSHKKTFNDDIRDNQNAITNNQNKNEKAIPSLFDDLYGSNDTRKIHTKCG